MNGSFYIHRSIFTECDKSSWRLDASYSIDSTLYPLLTLFELLKINPYQKVLSLSLSLVYIEILYKHTSCNDIYILYLKSFMFRSHYVFCFNQAEFTPEDLHSRKRVLNLEVCMTSVVFLFLCV
jgi:hypothetical protein